MKVKVDNFGRLLIPKNIRQHMGLKPGTIVILKERNNHLVVKLPLSQKIPVTSAVVVTTPQDLAMLDARKAVEMFKKVNVPVAGIVENMAVHTCSACGHQEHVFGTEGARVLSEACELPVLGSLPLDINIRKFSDQGVPIVLADPESAIAKTYIDIAAALRTSSMATPCSVNT